MMRKYLTLFAFFVVIIAIGNGIYEETNKPKVAGKTKRIPCLAKTTSFERGYGDKDIKKAQQRIQKGDYQLSSDIDKSTFMESTLFEYLDLKKLNDLVNTELQKSVQEQTITNEYLKIEYKIYENDREDPKKKSDNCKLFRGYVVLKVMNHKNKTVYQVQIDFMDQKGSDVPKALKCAIKAFTTFNKE